VVHHPDLWLPALAAQPISIGLKVTDAGFNPWWTAVGAMATRWGCVIATQGEACEKGCDFMDFQDVCLPGRAKHARTEIWVYGRVSTRMLRALRVLCVEKE